MLALHLKVKKNGLYFHTGVTSEEMEQTNHCFQKNCRLNAMRKPDCVTHWPTLHVT